MKPATKSLWVDFAKVGAIELAVLTPPFLLAIAFPLLVGVALLITFSLGYRVRVWTNRRWCIDARIEAWHKERRERRKFMHRSSTLRPARHHINTGAREVSENSIKHNADGLLSHGWRKYSNESLWFHPKYGYFDFADAIKKEVRIQEEQG
jgi:hypothetical protein